MKKHSLIWAGLFVLLTFALIGCMPGKYPVNLKELQGIKVLTGSEVQALAEGKTWTIERSKEAWTEDHNFLKDGALTSSKRGEGKWFVMDNKLCVSWTTQPGVICYRVATPGESYFLANDDGDIQSAVISIK